MKWMPGRSAPAISLCLLAAIASTLSVPVRAGGGDDALRVLTDPRGTVDWKLIQRASATGAPMPLVLTYRLGNTGQLQARIIRSDTGETLPGLDFADTAWPLPASPGERLRVTIADVPTGGNYDVLLRLIDEVVGEVVAEASINQVAVGDVYLAAGQSNMSGYSESLAFAEDPVDQVHLFGNDYVWKRAAEPMDGSLDQIDSVSLDFPAHSSLLRFAKEVYASTGVPVAVIPGPLGGSSLALQWQRDDVNPLNRETLYGSLLYRTRLQAYDVAPTGMLWFQGESDTLVVSPTYYRRLLRRLIGEYRTDLGDPQMAVLVAQLGTFTLSNLSTWIAVQEAQRQVAREDARVALVTAVDQPTWDTIHYTTQAYKTIGVRFALAARELLYAGAVDALTELTDISVGEDRRSVLLAYDGPVLAGEPDLYRVIDETGGNPVSAAAAEGSIITLSLSRPVEGTLTEVLYGNSRSFSSRWALDAAGIAVPVFRVTVE